MAPGSLIQLGFRFFKRVLFSLFTPSSKGIKRFVSNYSDDNLIPLSTPQRRLVESLSRCTACGMCDAVFPYEEINAAVLHKPSDLILSHSRGLDQFTSMQAELEELKKADLSTLSKVCPSRISFEGFVDFAEERIASANKQAP